MSHQVRQNVVILFFLALFGAVSPTSTCYYDTGVVDNYGHPCDPDAIARGGHSACCHANDVCWSDGSCSTYGGNIPYTMSCTDSSWDSSACPNIQCVDDEAKNTETWMAICFASNGTSCCLTGSPPNCCTDSSSDFFTYSPGAPVAILDSSGTPITGTSANVTTTVTAAAQASSSSGSNASAGPSNTGAVAGLGVALGVVFAAAGIAITALSMKLRSEMAMRKGTEMDLAEARGSHFTSQAYQFKGNPASSPWNGPPVELSSAHH